MSEPSSQVPEGQPTDASGDAGQSTDNPSPSKQVSYETYQKTVDEAKKAKARLKELEAAEKSRIETELAEKGEYKKLLSQRDEELKKIRDELDFNRKKEQDRMKLASILNAAGGDIESKFFGLIDYEDVVINPESGQVDEMSVAKVVEKLKATYPEIIKNPNAPKFPADAPKGNAAGKISRAEWLKLPSSEMKKWKFEQIME